MEGFERMRIRSTSVLSALAVGVVVCLSHDDDDADDGHDHDVLLMMMLMLLLALLALMICGLQFVHTSLAALAVEGKVVVVCLVHAPLRLLHLRPFPFKALASVGIFA